MSMKNVLKVLKRSGARGEKLLDEVASSGKKHLPGFKKDLSDAGSAIGESAKNLGKGIADDVKHTYKLHKEGWPKLVELSKQHPGKAALGVGATGLAAAGAGFSMNELLEMLEDEDQKTRRR